MHREHKVALFILVVVAGILLGIGVGKQLVREDPDELLKIVGVKEILYFETGSDLRRFEATNFVPTISNEHTTQGMYSLKVTFPPGGGNLSAYRSVERNWTGFRVFALDTYNDELASLDLTITIRDDRGAKPFTAKFSLPPGPSHLELTLAEMGEVINLSEIKQLVLGIEGALDEATVYFDNMRLVQ